MEPSLTDTLCTRCGLCCDGSLFADAELAGRREAARLELLGIEVDDDDDTVLVQPCAALQGTRCGVYAHRPQCCRTFECRLLLDVRRGAVEVGQAGARITEARRLVRRAKAALVRSGQRDHHLPLAERCEEALASDAGTGRVARQRRAGLVAAISALDRLVRSTFLGPAGARRPTERR